jgi:hypothetical protein
MARPTDRQPSPPARPPAYPPSPAARPPADPGLQQRAWAALLLAFISLFAMLMIGNVQRGVYVVALALVIAATAGWMAISAMSRARRAGSGRPRGAVLATVLAAGGFAFSAMVLVAFAAFWPELTQYSQCMAEANTHSAQVACHVQLDDSVGNEIAVFGS